jgi:hypothetical protein
MGTQIGFAATVIAVFGAIVGLVGVAAKRAGRDPRRDAAVVGGTIAVWLGITAGLAQSGVIAFGDGPPKALALPWIFIIGALIVLYRPAGRTFVANVPRAAVVGLQIFRVPVKLVLWSLFLSNDLPERMTFEGRNFDVLVGLTALPVAYLAWIAARRPKLALVWHLASLLLLANIVTMAIRARPPIIPTIPFVWLPAFLVPVALLSHIVGLQQALAARR